MSQSHNQILTNIKQKSQHTLELCVYLTLLEEISDVEKLAILTHFLFKDVFKYENAKWYLKDCKQKPPQWLEDSDGIQLNKFCNNYLVIELMNVTKQVNMMCLEAESSEKDQYLDIARKITNMIYLFADRDADNSFRKNFKSVCEKVFSLDHI